MLNAACFFLKSKLKFITRSLAHGMCLYRSDYSSAYYFAPGYDFMTDRFRLIGSSNFIQVKNPSVQILVGHSCHTLSCVLQATLIIYL